MLMHKQTDDGGLAAVDTDDCVAYYAYPTSEYATLYAHLSLEQREKFAKERMQSVKMISTPRHVYRMYYTYILDTYFGS